MKTNWYLVKVLPGKERQLCEDFNKQISQEKIKYIKRFICPTEKQIVLYKTKQIVREKVIYSGYLYFETQNKLSDDELKTISLTTNIMSMNKSKIPILLRESDVSRILKDEILDQHIDSKIIRYKVGEIVNVIDGPFDTFQGQIIAVNDEKVDVDIKIFGRNNVISLNLTQIKKI